MPPGVGADPTLERIAEVDQLAQLVDPPLRVGARQAVEPALEQEELGTRLARVERRLLQRDADAEAHRVGLVDDVEAGD